MRRILNYILPNVEYMCARQLYVLILVTGRTIIWFTSSHGFLYHIQRVEFTSDIFLPYLQPPCPLSCCSYAPPPSRFVNYPRYPYRYSMPSNWPASSTNQYPHPQLHSVPIPTVPTVPSYQLSVEQQLHQVSQTAPKPIDNPNNNYLPIPIHNQANHSSSMPGLTNTVRQPSSLSLQTSFGKSSTPSVDQLSDIDNNMRIERATPYYNNQSPMTVPGTDSNIFTNHPLALNGDTSNDQTAQHSRITDTSRLNIPNTKISSQRKVNGLVHDKHGFAYIDN